MRYLLFGGDAYYPSGGAEDLIGSYISRENAVAAAAFGESMMTSEPGFDWWHVYDTELYRVVAAGGNYHPRSVEDLNNEIRENVREQGRRIAARG